MNQFKCTKSISIRLILFFPLQTFPFLELHFANLSLHHTISHTLSVAWINPYKISVLFELRFWISLPSVFLHFSSHLVRISGITQPVIVVVWYCPSPPLQKTLADPLVLEISCNAILCVFSKHHLQLWEGGCLGGVYAHPLGDWCDASGACAAWLTSTCMHVLLG